MFRYIRLRTCLSLDKVLRTCLLYRHPVTVFLLYMYCGRAVEKVYDSTTTAAAATTAGDFMSAADSIVL